MVLLSFMKKTPVKKTKISLKDKITKLHNRIIETDHNVECNFKRQDTINSVIIGCFVGLFVLVIITGAINANAIKQFEGYEEVCTDLTNISRLNIYDITYSNIHGIYFKNRESNQEGEFGLYNFGSRDLSEQMLYVYDFFSDMYDIETIIYCIDDIVGINCIQYIPDADYVSSWASSVSENYFAIQYREQICIEHQLVKNTIIKQNNVFVE